MYIKLNALLGAEEARKGCQMPMNLNFGWLWALGVKPWSSARASAPQHCTISSISLLQPRPSWNSLWPRMALSLGCSCLSHSLCSDGALLMLYVLSTNWAASSAQILCLDCYPFQSIQKCSSGLCQLQGCNSQMHNHKRKSRNLQNESVEVTAHQLVSKFN